MLILSPLALPLADALSAPLLPALHIVGPAFDALRKRCYHRLRACLPQLPLFQLLAYSLELTLAFLQHHLCSVAERFHVDRELSGFGVHFRSDRNCLLLFVHTLAALRLAASELTGLRVEPVASSCGFRFRCAASIDGTDPLRCRRSAIARWRVQGGSWRSTAPWRD